MTYNAYEISQHDAEPVEFYDFVQGSTHYRYCSGQADVSYGGNTYTSTYIERDQMRTGLSLDLSDMQIRIARTNAIAGLFVAIQPTATLGLTIYRKHIDDGNVVAYWIGRVTGCNYQGPVAVLSCEPYTVSVQRAAPWGTFSPLCRWALYLDECGVTDTDFDTSAVLSSVSGNDIVSATFAGEANGYWLAGRVDWGGESRLVTAHTASTVTLTHPFDGLLAGETVTIFAGCSHTRAVCKARFLNQRAFGGFPSIPTENPFTTNLEKPRGKKI